MNTRVIVATIAGGAALFLLGFLIYGLLLEGWMKSQMVEYKGIMNETPNFATLIIANIVWALLVALIFDRWASISTFAGGLVGGAMISFLMILYYDLMNVSFMNLFTGFTAVFVDVIAFTIIGALAGGVVAAILGMMNKAATAEAA